MKRTAHLNSLKMTIDAWTICHALQAIYNIYKWRTSRKIAGITWYEVRSFRFYPIILRDTWRVYPLGKKFNTKNEYRGKKNGSLKWLGAIEKGDSFTDLLRSSKKKKKNRRRYNTTKNIYKKMSEWKKISFKEHFRERETFIRWT